MVIQLIFNFKIKFEDYINLFSDDWRYLRDSLRAGFFSLNKQI